MGDTRRRPDRRSAPWCPASGHQGTRWSVAASPRSRPEVPPAEHGRDVTPEPARVASCRRARSGRSPRSRPEGSSRRGRRPRCGRSLCFRHRPPRPAHRLPAPIPPATAVSAPASRTATIVCFIGSSMVLVVCCRDVRRADHEDERRPPPLSARTSRAHFPPVVVYGPWSWRDCCAVLAIHLGVVVAHAEHTLTLRAEADHRSLPMFRRPSPSGILERRVVEPGLPGAAV